MHLSEYIRKKPQNGKGNRKGTVEIRQGYCEQAGGAPFCLPIEQWLYFLAANTLSSLHQ